MLYLFPFFAIESNEFDSRLRRAASLGHGDKPRRDRPKRTRSMHSAATLKRKKEAAMRKKDKGTNTPNSPSKMSIDRLQAHWTANIDSSDDEIGSDNSASESLQKILQRENRTVFEVAPEFKLLPRDVTVDAPANVKLTCTLMASPTADVTWTKNDTMELKPGDKYNIVYKKHVCVLEILRTHPSDSGTYTVTASNALGSASCCAKVTVRGLAKPGSPSRPCITAMTSTSVVLAWDPPDTVDRIPITAYTVEYKETSAATWQIAVGVVTNTTTIVDDLVPAKTYQFRVSANNDVGISDPSPPSDAITMDLEAGVKSILASLRLRRTLNSRQERKGKVVQYKLRKLFDSKVEHFSTINHSHSKTPPGNPCKDIEDAVLSPTQWREGMEEHYNLYSELGRGRFSLVKKCVEKNTGKEYAAKLIRRRSLDKEEVENEVAILRTLNHPSLCKIYDTFESQKNLILILELLPGGRLFDHIVIMDNLTEKIAIGFVKQILQALQYLHECNVVHLDLKPENLLLSSGSHPRLKLADFGEAIQISSHSYIHELNGSSEFTAPEIINGEPVSLATDMWSLGVIVYVLLSGVSPFYSDNHERACHNITEIRYRFPSEFFDYISSEAKDFIEELLIIDQEHRPDTKECLRFPWLRMVEPGFKPQAPNKRISLSRLAAFNARRRYQNEMTTSSSSNIGYSSKNKNTSEL